jgi:nucleoid-associated protein YgaU
MTSVLKLAVAVVCLVGIAALIAFDLYRSTPAEVPAAPPPATPVAAVVPVAPPEPEKKPAPVLPSPAPEPAATPVAVVPPPPVKKAAPILIETLPGGARVYTVVQGDTLYGISVKVFGSPRHYERIYEANREKIEDPNTLQIGLKLALPDVPAKSGAGEPVPISSTK